MSLSCCYYSIGGPRSWGAEMKSTISPASMCLSTSVILNSHFGDVHRGITPFGRPVHGRCARPRPVRGRDAVSGAVPEPARDPWRDNRVRQERRAERAYTGRSWPPPPSRWRWPTPAAGCTPRTSARRCRPGRFAGRCRRGAVGRRRSAPASGPFGHARTPLTSARPMAGDIAMWRAAVPLVARLLLTVCRTR